MRGGWSNIWILERGIGKGYGNIMGVREGGDMVRKGGYGSEKGKMGSDKRNGGQ